MATKRNDRKERDDRDMTNTRTEGRSSVPNDLPDTDRDRKELQAEETFIDMPDVKDIPGQEFVHAAPLGELADTTIASADEEGDEIFAEEDEEDIVTMVRDERKAGTRDRNNPSNANTTDDDNLRKAALDNTDFQGEPLNE